MTDTPSSQQDESWQAEVVQEHLPPGFSAEFDGASDDRAAASNSAPDLTSPPEQSSLKLQGGDIHRELYKIDARARLHQRAQTFSGPDMLRPVASDAMPVSEQRALGGFRREFVQQKYGSLDARNIPVARSFVDFLDLYGSFAGEDLAESEETSETEDDDDAERRPLLPRRKSSKANKKGDASSTKTFFTLLKAFVGTGIMFLPKAFQNGGLVFSSVTLVSVSLISTIAFHLLLKCRAQYGGGYGDLGEAIGGSKMRTIILSSITLSQLGFVCSGIIFVADNLRSFADAVSNGSNPLSTRSLIALQLIVLIPLSLIRNISKLGPAAMLADVFILIGLTYIWYFDIASISQHGIADSVVLFNPDHYTLTIGAAIFTFEGIGLILPIQSSMKHPEKFEWLLYAIMALITLIFGSVGLLCYMTFGSETRIEVITNFPQDSKIVNAVQFLYSIAVLVGNPVQLFPAVRILEGKLFGHLSGKYSRRVQWKKNIFRFGMVILCTLVSILGAANLDRFVALIGSLACVPLVYIYPPLLHYWGVAETRLVKTGDIALLVLGVVGMVYTTTITIVTSFIKT